MATYSRSGGRRTRKNKKSASLLCVITIGWCEIVVRLVVGDAAHLYVDVNIVKIINLKVIICGIICLK